MFIEETGGRYETVTAHLA